MIRDYEIKYIDNNEILYIYLDFNSEFANLDSKDKKKNLKKYIEDFINGNKIKFSGVKVVIIVSGVMIGSLYLNNNKNYKTNNSNYVINLVKDNKNIINDDIVNNEYNNYINLEENEKVESSNKNDNSKLSESYNQQNNYKYNDVKLEDAKENTIEVTNNINGLMITLYRNNGETLNIELEEYLIGVVGAEMPVSFHIEALKAQAVVARTYTLKSISNNKKLTDDSSTQNYKSIDELKNMWGNNFNKYYEKVKLAVYSTKDEYLTYNGNYIDAVYHSTSNGKTENASYVWGNSFPYLVSVESIYDDTNSKFLSNMFVSNEELSIRLEKNIDNNTIYNIVSRNESGRVEKISIDNIIYTGVEIRNKLGLRSTDFEIEKLDTGVNFITKGYGHGVGMSQYGANGMANNGASYNDILLHYYKGVVIYKL